MFVFSLLLKTTMTIVFKTMGTATMMTLTMTMIMIIMVMMLTVIALTMMMMIMIIATILMMMMKMMLMKSIFLIMITRVNFFQSLNTKVMMNMMISPTMIAMKMIFINCY